MLFIRQFFLISLLSFNLAASIHNGVDEKHSRKGKHLRHQQVVVVDADWDDSVHAKSYGNETTPAPTVSPSSNNTTTPSPTVTPTTSPPTTATPTTAPPTTAPPTTAPPTTAPPTTAPPTPSPTHGHHREWWQNLFKLLLKTACWIFIAIVFFFAFGAVMSNRYRIYYYVRGSWYSLLQKLKGLRRGGRDGSAPSSTLNDIIFSDNDMGEGLLTRET